jgi:hypothetical protein
MTDLLGAQRRTKQKDPSSCEVGSLEEELESELNCGRDEYCVPLSEQGISPPALRSGGPRISRSHCFPEMLFPALDIVDALIVALAFTVLLL